MSDDTASRRDDLRTLGLVPTAAAPDILDAYLRLRRALRADSTALRAAASEDERRSMLQRVEEAYFRLAAQAGQPANVGGPWHVLAGAPGAGSFAAQPSPGSWARPPAPACRPAAPPLGTPGPERLWLTPAPEEGAPSLDVRSRPSPFRARPSLPLS